MPRIFATFCALFFVIATLAFADGRADAEKMVKDAIGHYKKVGKEAAIVDVNKGKFRNGEVYVTIYNVEGKCLAHPVKASQVGLNLMDMKDANGVFFVKERVKLAKEQGKGWQKYKWKNPETNKLEDKEVYLESLDGLIFSAGVYDKK